MKCPHCGYEDHISGNEEGFVQGLEGDFFVVGLATRENKEHPTLVDKAKVYACPKCSKVFMNKRYY